MIWHATTIKSLSSIDTRPFILKIPRMWGVFLDILQINDHEDNDWMKTVLSISVEVTWSGKMWKL